MNQILLLALLGVGAGGFYGLLAMGVVVGYKGSGVVNLAQGAMAMYPAYTYLTLREEGAVVMPWFDFLPGPVEIPTRLELGVDSVPGFWAVVGALAMAVLLGLAAHYLVFGPLKRAPAVSKVIGSLGILLYLQAVALFHFGGRARTTEGILPGGGLDNPLGLGGRLTYDRLTLAMIAIVVGLGLTWYYRRTMLGLATRGADESELGAAVLGWSASRLAALNWVIASLVTGLAGILFLDVTSLTPTRYTLFIVPALGAALVGNLQSALLAAIGGVALGSVQSAVSGLTLYEWWPDVLPAGGMRQAVPLLVIVVLQYSRGHLLPARGAVFETRQPFVPPVHRPVRWMAVGVVVIAVLSATGDGADESRLVTSLIAAVLMLSSVVLVGYLGQVSLAQLAFAGIAAFGAARLASDGSQVDLNVITVDGPGLPDPLAALIGVAFAVVIGLATALPALRIRGMQLAIVTLAVAVAATELVFANETLVGGGAGANTPVPRPEWFGADVGVRDLETGLTDRTTFTVFVTIALAAVVLAVANLRRGHTGRRFLATRSNERAVAAVGVDVVRTKLLGFGIGAAIAGVAGVLIAYQTTILQFQSWTALGGILSLALLFIGGVGSFGGVVIGSLLVPAGVLSSSSSEGEILRTAVSGAVLVAVAVFRPDGLASLAAPIRRWLEQAGRRIRGSGPPGPSADASPSGGASG